MERSQMVVRDDQPEFVVSGPGAPAGPPPEHHPSIDPSALGQRTREPRPGIGGEMRKRSRRLGREVERQWGDGSPETLLGVSVRAEPRVRLAQPKARVHLQM